MRVAVCLSGQTRSMDRCLDSLIKYVVKPLQADVFFHFWSESETHPALDFAKYRLESRPDWPPFDADIARRAILELDPRKFIVQPQLQFDDSVYQRECTTANSRMQAVSYQHVLSMYYSIFMANACRVRWEVQRDEEYDCVIRVRADMLFHEEIRSEWLDDLSKVYIPDEEGYGGRNDQFAFSNPENMDKYCDTVNFIPKHFQRGGNFHPETILRHSLDEHKLEVADIPMIYELAR